MRQPACTRAAERSTDDRPRRSCIPSLGRADPRSRVLRATQRPYITSGHALAYTVLCSPTTRVRPPTRRGYRSAASPGDPAETACTIVAEPHVSWRTARVVARDSVGAGDLFVANRHPPRSYVAQLSGRAIPLRLSRELPGGGSTAKPDGPRLLAHELLALGITDSLGAVSPAAIGSGGSRVPSPTPHASTATAPGDHGATGRPRSRSWCGRIAEFTRRSVALLLADQNSHQTPEALGTTAWGHRPQTKDEVQVVTIATHAATFCS